MGPYQRTPKYVARAIRYSGLGVRSMGPVGDFLDFINPGLILIHIAWAWHGTVDIIWQFDISNLDLQNKKVKPTPQLVQKK